MFCTSIISATIILGSIHIQEQKDTTYNNFNPGIVLECNNHIVFGGYRNSGKKATFLAGYDFRWNLAPKLSAGFVSSFCTGYKYPVCITGILEYDGFTLTGIPKLLKHQNVGVISFSYTFHFN